MRALTTYAIFRFQVLFNSLYDCALAIKASQAFERGSRFDMKDSISEMLCS